MEEYFDVYDKCTSSEAKKEYFLTTKDLLSVPHQSDYFGFGMGRPTKWYSFDDLEAAAIAKHGAAGLAKKRAAREKRRMNQQQKELAAQKAKENIIATTSSGVATVNDENAPTTTTNKAPSATLKMETTPSNSISKKVVVTAKELQKLRKDIVKAFKPMLTYDYLRRKNKKNFVPAKAEIPRVSPEQYATLIGRPNDTKLASVVKKGAWYREVIPYQTVMGSSSGSMMGTGGRYGCNGELGIDYKSQLVVRYKPSDETLIVEGTVQHVDTFAYDDDSDSE